MAAVEGTTATAASTDDIVAAFEAAMRSGAEAAIATFRAELTRKSNSPGMRAEALFPRYRPGSWKHDVLSIALELAKKSEVRQFRFSDFAADEELLRERHPDQKAIMSGVSVTLQGLVRDGALEQVARGLYRVV